MDIRELSPSLFYRYFYDIAQIPHGSGNTEALSDYLCRFAQQNGFPYERDETGNVLIRGKATAGYEDHPPVLLQGHMDMVCVSEPDVEHDFFTQPLDVDTDGEWVFANGTTLGADDACAVAMMLAVLTDETAEHPALECLATVDEETGMDGANALDPSWIRARRMLNMDSEEEGTLIAGCAGGAEVACGIPVEHVTLKGGRYRITVSGLNGGHSGSEIAKPLASANKLMGRILRDLDAQYAVSIVELTGGEKMNAIATEASCVILADTSDQSDLIAYCSQLTAALRKEYAGSDDSILVRCIPEGPAVVSALSYDSAQKIIRYLELVPHGLMRMLADPADVPSLSTNLGIIGIDGDLFYADNLVRSAVKESKADLCERIMLLTELLGGTSEIQGEYPEWPYRPESSLLKKVAGIYEDIFGAAPKTAVTHGGLECGLISEKIPNMEIVSFGPELPGIHTPAEKMNVASLERTYRFLLAALAAL